MLTLELRQEILIENSHDESFMAQLSPELQHEAREHRNRLRREHQRRQEAEHTAARAQRAAAATAIGGGGGGGGGNMAFNMPRSLGRARRGAHGRMSPAGRGPYRGRGRGGGGGSTAGGGPADEGAAPASSSSSISSNTVTDGQ